MTASKEISSNSFKNAITNKLFTYKSYVYACKCLPIKDKC